MYSYEDFPLLGLGYRRIFDLQAVEAPKLINSYGSHIVSLVYEFVL